MSATVNLQPKTATIRLAIADGADAIDVNCIGDSKLLDCPRISLFCSSQCPGSAILTGMKWVGGVADNQDVAIAAGFHSAMEKSFLEVLLAGSCSVLVFPARSLARYRVPAVFHQPIADSRLCVVSSFNESVHSATTSSSRRRNQLVADVSEILVVAYAAPGSRTERFAMAQLERGRPVLCLHSGCIGLIEAGARLLSTTYNRKDLGTIR